MSNSFEKSLIDRIPSVKVLKRGKNKDRINDILKNLQNDFVSIEKFKQNIKDAASYNKYVNELKRFLEMTIEQITAPYVEDFISWISEITDDLQNSSALKDYLLKNYSDSINGLLENIILHKGCLVKENSIFRPMMQETKEIIKKKLKEFLLKPDEYENSTDNILTKLAELLKYISSLPELSYTNIDQLFSVEEKNNRVDRYLDIIKKLIEVNQSIKPIEENEKNKSIFEIIKTRILDITGAIDLLNKTNIANLQDETLKNIFLKFKEDMIKFEGGIKNNLEEWIDDQWKEIEQNYLSIKTFFDEKIKLEFKWEWEQFINGQIKPIEAEYSEILKDNPLTNIITYKPKGIKDTLSKKNKIINEFKVKCESLKTQIINEFERLLSEYKDKNIPLLERLVKNNSNLQSKIEKLNGYLEGLENGKNEIEKANILNYLNGDFTHDLDSYLEISDLFKKALQDSGKSEHLKWLDEKLRGAECGDLSVEDFKNQNLIKELLSDGLIKINIEKQF